VNTNILLCGVGGQGTVLASKLIASCAMEKGYSVMSAETIGMAQKGGSVFSFLRIGDRIYSPMFARHQADLLIAFEPAEAVRMIDYLKPDGTAIVASKPVMPVTSVLSKGNYSGSEMTDYITKNISNSVIVDSEKACRDLGSARVLNMVLLGTAVKSGVLPFDLADAVSAMEKTVKPQFVELNTKALNYNA